MNPHYYITTLTDQTICEMFDSSFEDAYEHALRVWDVVSVPASDALHTAVRCPGLRVWDETRMIIQIDHSTHQR